ncbi:hypothetical protein [Pseudomonas sp. MYb118]|uniref:hypothetical protein n=1 Tax=Pseudomonas sp. MYb118 TaxID=1848720 RepID=UPI0034CFC344
MTAKPSTMTKQVTYLGHEIFVETFGPVTARPRDTGGLQTHHTTKVSVWFDGKELEEARETPSLLFVSREDAAELGFEIGQMIVDQRRESVMSSPIIFKMPRLALSLLRD